jgi:serine/threonine protein kinase/WD40 repeat protein
MEMGPQDPDPSHELGIFLVARDLPEGRVREAFLDGACRSDSLLRSRIERLLAADGDDSLIGAEAISSALDDAVRARSREGGDAPSAMSYSGDYVVEEMIARGGMGTVYRGVQATLARHVALKVIHADGSADSRYRFQREAETLAQLNHPNIVPIHDLVRENGLPVCFSMKLVEGRTLQQITNRLRDRDAETLQEFPLARLLTIFLKVCDAISFAHSRGVLHRDLKPENLMVGDFGEVLVMDWGLAKQKNETSAPVETDKGRGLLLSSGGSDTDPSFLATMEGSVMGTPRYMSPEQAMGLIDEIDEQSDVFSLGGILYALLTLRPPVEGSTLNEILAKVSSGEITPPTRFGSATTTGSQPVPPGETLPAKEVRPLPHLAGGRVPAALSAVTMKALALKKEKRYRSVAALGSDIEAYQNGFATSAEEAGALKQIKLLMGRHKAVTAALALILVIASLFVVMLAKSEREARRAFAFAQLEVADSARRESDLAALTNALEAVPEDLRDQRWHYLSDKRTETRREIAVPELESFAAVRAIPGARGWFAIASREGVVVIKNVERGETSHRIETAYCSRLCLGVSPDGKRLAVSSNRADTVMVLSIESGAILQTLTTPGSHPAHLVFSPGGGEILVADDRHEGQKAVLFDLRTGAEKWRRDGFIPFAAFTPAGDRLFLADPLRRVYEFADTDTGAVGAATPEYASAMAMSPDGQQVALGLFTGEVILIDPEGGGEIRRGKLHNGPVTAIFWTTHGHLITFGRDGTIQSEMISCRLWDPSTFVQKTTFFGLGAGPFETSWDYDPLSGNLLLVDDTLERHHLPVDLESSRIVSKRAEQAWSARFLSDSRLLARAEFELRIYDVSDPSMPRPAGPILPSNYLVSARLSESVFALGKRIAAPPFSIKRYVVDGDSPKEDQEIALTGQAKSLDFDPSGKWIVCAMTRDSGLALVDMEARKVQTLYPGTYHDAVFAGAVGEPGSIVAIRSMVAGKDPMGDSLVVHRADAAEPETTRPFPFRLHDLAASPDRNLVALAGGDGDIRILRAGHLEDLHHFRAHDDEITAVTFHPQLRIVASAANDGCLKLWDYENARLLATHYGPTGAVVMLDFSPNGKLLVAECQDEATRIYDLGNQDFLKPRLNEK